MCVCVTLNTYHIAIENLPSAPSHESSFTCRSPLIPVHRYVQYIHPWKKSCSIILLFFFHIIFVTIPNININNVDRKNIGTHKVNLFQFAFWLISINILCATNQAKPIDQKFSTDWQQQQQQSRIKEWASGD